MDSYLKHKTQVHSLIFTLSTTKLAKLISFLEHIYYFNSEAEYRKEERKSPVVGQWTELSWPQIYPRTWPCTRIQGKQWKVESLVKTLKIASWFFQIVTRNRYRPLPSRIEMELCQKMVKEPKFHQRLAASMTQKRRGTVYRDPRIFRKILVD